MADLKDELEASLKQGPPTDDPVWARFEELLASKEAIPVKIEAVVKGGVTTTIDGIRAFIPASKAAASRVEDLETLKGLETEAVVITAERPGKKLVLSVRDALRRKEKASRAAAMAECVEGAVMEGVVDSLMDYGAFIKLNNGVSGLLHVSQISYERVAKPSDVLKEGDPITVKIIGVKDGKISLSKKALEEAPARKERAPRGDRPEREPREGDRERRPRERREREEVFNYKETGKASTSLGDLLSGIKLDD
ncbi:MAG: S1 RNA-binding domain-containing protein [Lachnospiraceae bacterium]|nr:S1 RNA-binding domain-containing protein [Lachnospiraceae bacterium]